MTPLRDAAENATAGVPVVRGLVWEDAPGDIAEMQCEGVAAVGPNYVARAVWHGQFGKIWYVDGFGRDTWFKTLDLAKSAAQADYEQRITSALNPDFLSELDTARAEIDRLRAALKPFAAIGQYLIDQGFTTKPDNGDMWGFDGISVTYGDFRTAARATLSPVKENDRGLR